MTLLADWQIKDFAEQGMITPFIPEIVRQVGDRKVLSYGLGHYGYDIRLSPKEFKVFRHVPGTIVDPKNFNPDNLQNVELQEDENGEYFTLPGNSYGLGVAVEQLKMPCNITATCLGKSSYARVGVIVNVTPAEAGWVGHLTLEFSNSAHSDVRLYANEGISQLLFFQGADCGITYSDRNGKYMNQPESIIYSKV